MSRAAIAIPTEHLADFCRRHHIRTMALFGSVLREDFTDRSDVDVLVEFEPGRTPGWEIVDMERELSVLLRREADLRTTPEINKRFRDEVLAEAEVVYVQA